MSNGMVPGDRVAYVDNDFPTLGTVREASGARYFVAWDDTHESDWFSSNELAVIEKADRSRAVNEIPNEAVEAAYQAYLNDGSPTALGSMRVVLRAALPILRRQWESEIAALTEAGES